MQCEMLSAMRLPALFASLFLMASPAAEVSLTEQTFHGRPAWVLENGVMRVAVLKGGGHIAEVRQTTGDARRDVNPMRVPHYPTIDPQTYNDARDNPIYGDD